MVHAVVQHVVRLQRRVLPPRPPSARGRHTRGRGRGRAGDLHPEEDGVLARAGHHLPPHSAKVDTKVDTRSTATSARPTSASTCSTRASRAARPPAEQQGAAGGTRLGVAELVHARALHCPPVPLCTRPAPRRSAPTRTRARARAHTHAHAHANAHAHARRAGGRGRRRPVRRVHCACPGTSTRSSSLCPRPVPASAPLAGCAPRTPQPRACGSGAGPPAKKGRG